MYSRRVLAGEFTVVNKYLLRDLIDRGLWTQEVRNQIMHDRGSVQNVAGMPQDLKVRTVGCGGGFGGVGCCVCGCSSRVSVCLELVVVPARLWCAFGTCLFLRRVCGFGCCVSGLRSASS